MSAWGHKRTSRTLQNKQIQLSDWTNRPAVLRLKDNNDKAKPI